MGKWLLSVVGIIFLGVLFDLLYPNGKTNKLCKSIFGLISIFVIISPVFSLDYKELSTKVASNKLLIKNLNKSKNVYLKQKIELHLESRLINGVNVEIDSNLTLNEYEIENIYVDTTNLVLTENVTNINKYEVIQNEILSVVDIDVGRIIIYG